MFVEPKEWASREEEVEDAGHREDTLGTKVKFEREGKKLSFPRGDTLCSKVEFKSKDKFYFPCKCVKKQQQRREKWLGVCRYSGVGEVEGMGKWIIQDSLVLRSPANSYAREAE